MSYFHDNEVPSSNEDDGSDENSNQSRVIDLKYETPELQPLSYVDEILYQAMPQRDYVSYFLNNEDGKIWFRVDGIMKCCNCMSSCCILPCCSEYPARITNAINGKEMIRVERCMLDCGNCWMLPFRALWYKNYVVQNVSTETGEHLGRIIYARTIKSTTFQIFDSDGRKIYSIKCPSDKVKAKNLKLQILSVEKGKVTGDIGNIVIGYLQIVYAHGIRDPLVYLKFPRIQENEDKCIEHRGLLLALMMLYRRLCHDIYLNL